MSAKATLGYPSRTEAVIGLRGQGYSTRQIAEAVGIQSKTVVALELSAARARREPKEADTPGRGVLFPVDILDALSPHAAKRGIHANTLARMIVETVVDENMIDAVLDDAADWGLQ